MGRVNVEGDLETHAEFFAVLQHFLPLVGGNVRLAKKTALGDLVDFFRLARKRFEEPSQFPFARGVITAEDLKKEGLEHMIETGWAVAVDPDAPPENPEDLYRWTARGFQAKNANKHFNWIVSSKKNGMKRGRRAGAEDAPGEQPGTGREAPGNPPVPARPPEATIPSPDPDPSLSNSHTSAGSPDASRLTPLARVWNEHCGKLPKVRELTRKRIQLERTARKAHPSLEDWVDVVQRVAGSAFCNGGGDQGWKADFDWLLKPETYHGVLEGKWGCLPTPRSASEPACELKERRKADGYPFCNVHYVNHPRCRLQLEHERARAGGGPAP